MTYFAGFDTDRYPGDEVMDWLKANTPLAWCASYLAPAPSHSDISWRGRRAGLAAKGWGVLPVFLGQQTYGPGSHNVNPVQGAIDGGWAANLTRAEGFPEGTTVILDWEDGTLKPEAPPYIGAWVAALFAGGYRPGIYCSHNLAATMSAVVAAAVAAASVSAGSRAIPPGPVTVWAWNVKTSTTGTSGVDIRQLQPQDPAGCGFDAAALWQFEQNAVVPLPSEPQEAPSMNAPRTLNLDLSWSLQSRF